ncbi:MAG: FtsX-like permease family protein [Bacteroidales bacterium]|nr:FtsX-like permease family protein [Bacteroidales bacterium]
MSYFDLKQIIRSLFRQKYYTLINILGFALGISVFLLILLYIADQRAYDRWHEHSREVYRLEKTDWALLGTAHGPFLKRKFPEVHSMTRVLTMHIYQTLSHNDIPFSEQDIIFADSTVFNIFSYRFLLGDPKTALTDPSSIVLTESLASNIFGRTDVMGEILRYGNDQHLMVTGVIEDVTHSHLRVTGIIPFHLLSQFYSHLDPDFLYQWGSWNYSTFLRLQPDTDIAHLEEKINDAIYEELRTLYEAEIERDFFLRPLPDIYFADDVKHAGPAESGNLQTVRLFLAVAAFILLIAVVNYVNLATARSSLRAREVGIRRLLGSRRRKLVARFLFESFLITALAVLCALLIMEVVMPWYRDFAGISITLYSLDTGTAILSLLAGIVFVGVLSGIYPALYLTSVVPIDIFRGNRTGGKKGAFFRKILIVFQFTISLALITATVVINQQLSYMRNRDLGIDLDHKYLIRLESNTYQRWDAFRTALEEHPGITGIGRSAQVPGYVTWQESSRGAAPESKQHTTMQVNAEYLSVMGVKAAAGRLFSREFPSEHRRSVILNEQAVHYFDYKGSYEEIIGQSFSTGMFEHDLRIIGIVQDFHYNSLHNPIAPLVILWDDDGSYNVTVHIDPSRYSDAVAHMNKVWMEFAPATPFMIEPIGGLFMKFYKKEQQLQYIFVVFSFFAIFIACLGLLGLASFMAEQRQKEMAIRKVAGAGLFQLAALVLSSFLKLLAIAFMISTPVSYVLLSHWVDTFPYHISIGLMPFAIAAIVSLIITCLTVAYHAVKVASVAPGSVLKSE